MAVDQVRCSDEEWTLVARAAAAAGLSINAWINQATKLYIEALCRRDRTSA